MEKRTILRAVTGLNNKTAMGRAEGRTGVLNVLETRLVRLDVPKKLRKLRTVTWSQAVS